MTLSRRRIGRSDRASGLRPRAVQQVWDIVTVLFVLLMLAFLAFCFLFLGGIGRAFHGRCETIGPATTRNEVALALVAPDTHAQ